ncbi:microsomal glutathione S-transferase 1-like [Babylonia areolata]|uniref:microsomal glutathione S-transferase 1-like n=1 Tax=Babylonia areolata TaxID=304850 RepID=UPI003FD49574
MSDVLSFGNESFNNLAFYSGLVLCKTVLMGPLTSVFRIKNKVFSNPEDVARFAPGKSINTNDDMVERIRRCHQNDLENVVPFTLIGLFYVSAEPDPDIALRIFRIFAASRMLHTVAYLVPLPQPARAACYFAGVGATGLMAFFLFARLTFFK